MTNHTICNPIPSGELDPARRQTEGFIHPRSMLCPFAMAGLPRQPSGCCHFGADALMSLLKRCNTTLARRLTPNMVPGEARRFSANLAKALGAYLNRDDMSLAGLEHLAQGIFGSSSFPLWASVSE